MSDAGGVTAGGTSQEAEGAGTADRRARQYTREDLLRLCEHPDEDVAWWAAQRLAGDDGLLAVLVGPHEQAAHLASHILYTDCWAPDPGAVRAAWASVSDAYRPVLAEMAARAGWVSAAEEWAARAGEVPVAQWCAVAHALLPLRPDHLAAAGADLWDKADPQGGEIGGLLAVAAAAPAVMPIATISAFAGGGVVSALEGALLVGETASVLAAALQEQGSEAGGAAGAPAVPGAPGRARSGADPLRETFRGWRAAVPPPWELVRDGREPARGTASLQSALRALQGSLPPAPEGLAGQSAFLDGARRRCLALLADVDVAQIVFALGPQSGTRGNRAPYAGVWALAVSLYSAIAHPVDWWGPLADPSASLFGGALDASDRAIPERDPAERGLALLSGVYGDPPPWYPRLAGRGGTAPVRALMRVLAGEGDAGTPGTTGGGVGTTGAGDAARRLAAASGGTDHGGSWSGGPSPLMHLRLCTIAPRAAVAALERDGALLGEDAAVLYEAVCAALVRTPRGLDHLTALGRFLSPSVAPQLRRLLEGDGQGAAGTAPAETRIPDTDTPPQVREALRRHVALWLIQEMPWAEAGSELAAALPRLITDRLLWPDAAASAAETGSPAALAALLALWRPGDREIGQELLRMATVEEVLGRAVPAGIAAVRADLGAQARRDTHHAHTPTDGEKPAWPLRAALQCGVCARVHVYDVRRINVCEDPSPDGTDGSGRPRPEGLPPRVRWGRTGRRSDRMGVNLARDVLPAPRFVCRSCGAAGRARSGPNASMDIDAEIRRWNRLHDERGCPLGDDHGAGHAASRHAGAVPPEGAEWHDHVQFFDPMPWGPFGLSVKDLIEETETRVAEGGATPADALFLAQQWFLMGDPEAAHAFADTARRGPESAELHSVLAEIAEAEGHRDAAISHWRTALTLAERRPGGNRAIAAGARAALREVAPGSEPVAAAPAAAGRRGASRRDAVGRNDPCPCGSGKKYKRCHGA